jgi:hypothetical protein
MPFPEEPCSVCPRISLGLPMPCRAMTSGHSRYCDLVAMGREDYISLLSENESPSSQEMVHGFQSEQVDKQAPEFPSLGRQLLNLAGSAATFVKGGAKVASPEEQERRLSICRSNVCGQWVDGRCAKCGCRLMAKVKGQDLHCPLPEPLW